MFYQTLQQFSDVVEYQVYLQSSSTLDFIGELMIDNGLKMKYETFVLVIGKVLNVFNGYQNVIA